MIENKQNPCLTWRRMCNNREIPSDKETELKSDSSRTNPEVEQMLRTLTCCLAPPFHQDEVTAIPRLRIPELYSHTVYSLKWVKAIILSYVPENAWRPQSNNLIVKHSSISILSWEVIRDCTTAQVQFCASCPFTTRISSEVRAYNTNHLDKGSKSAQLNH